jgi:hypothetical protein
MIRPIRPFSAFFLFRRCVIDRLSILWAVSLLVVGCATGGGSSTAENASEEPTPSAETTRSGSGVLGAIVMYLPNRVFDVLDVCRLRARVGPGFTVSARATKLLSVAVGSHFTLFAGPPGPRQKASIPIPVGVEAFNGAQISVIEVGATGGDVPHYSRTEVGLGLQLLLIGLDIGVDPWELVDLAAGILFIDPSDDDI